MIVVGLDVGIYLIAIIEVVGECSIDIGKGQAGMSRDDFIWAHRSPLMFYHNVFNSDTVAIDSRLTAARSRRADNPHTLWRRTGRWLR
jgi:hypothetical protein